ALTVAAPGLLSNDSSPNTPGPLRAVLDTAPPSSAGTLVLNPDGSFTFTPAAGFAGAGALTYRVTDGPAASAPGTVTSTGASAPATVTITVTNRPPVGQPDTFSAQAGQALTVAAPGVLSNDSDPDNTGPLSAVLDTAPPAAQGAVVLNADGSFTFTPAAGF